MAAEKILVVDDEKLIRYSLCDRLRREGYVATEAEDGGTGLKALAADDVDLVLLDLRLPDTNGLKFLGDMRAQNFTAPVVLMTAYSSVKDAVEAMKLGAFDYISKPFEMDEMVLTVRRALETTGLRRELDAIHRESRDRYGLQNVVGASASMREITDLVRKVARSGATTILIQGESGTGKEVLARAIHYESERAHRPFMAIACTALPEALLESELYGHERGAFTDAKVQKKGLLEVAHEGSVFLDEIGDMPLPLQAKFLRFLEGRTLRRVGGTVDIPVNVRVIAATNRDLEKFIADGRFRSDLYYRLNVIRIRIPPLRERREDIRALGDHFIAHFNREFKRSVKGVAPEAFDALDRYAWPGNVRELKNTVERAMILGDGPLIGADDLPREIVAPGAAPAAEAPFALPPQGVNLEAMERSLVMQALERTRHNQTAAARLLGMTRDQIRYRLEKYGMSAGGEGEGTAPRA
jgi:DNA-binding NtrC family response regulator